ncbi:host attachment protein [Aquabacterium olei]|uniref:Host attachment protein n=1 Tax=Aquabacterium olei TaxID=1296669 RepID=A0A2U8FS57_9BURK|nr:host attachment protein [Aquabacterium olei]AWI53106.1 host attachment protein [Aquabacterium olei]
MPTTWVVVADEAIARIMQQRPEDKGLDAVEELTDPDAHARESDLRRDAFGRRGMTVTASAGDGEKHKEADAFATDVAGVLDKALQQGRYTRLILIAAPRFLGLLRKAVSPGVAAVIERELDKDLVHETHEELAARLRPTPPT